MVRNIAFEATEKELREIFKTFGELKSVRLPKKVRISRMPLDVKKSTCAVYVARGAIHQLLSIILILRILVLLPVSTMPYVVNLKNYSLIGE
jgi:hypothetical protein